MDNEIARVRRYTSEKIKYYRRINNFSQDDMAEKLWMSKRAYHRLENGQTALTLDRIHQLAKIFKVTISHLVGFEFELKDADMLREIRSINQQHMMNENRIIEILKELKDRMA